MSWFFSLKYAFPTVTSVEFTPFIIYFAFRAFSKQYCSVDQLECFNSVRISIYHSINLEGFSWNNGSPVNCIFNSGRGRQILTELSLCYSIVYHYNGAQWYEQFFQVG